MSPMPDFPVSVELVELDQNLNVDDASHAYDRKISVSEAEKSNLSIFKSKESSSEDKADSDVPRTEKTTLMRENSVDTLASKLEGDRKSSLATHSCIGISLLYFLQAASYHFAQLTRNYGAPRSRYSPMAIFACHIYPCRTWICNNFYLKF